MASSEEQHSRRDFLQGRAAVRTLANKAQSWMDSAVEVLGNDRTAGPVAHIHASRRAMACEFSVQYHPQDRQENGSDINDDVLSALDLIERIEDRLTIYRDHSEVIALNQQAAIAPVTVNAELYALLELSQSLYRETQGAFDITSGPLSRVWGFLQRAGRMPEEADRVAALEQVGGDQINLSQSQRTIAFENSGVEINFNSIGKGYALDQAAALLQEAGHDDFLWQCGGSSVLARGNNRASRRAGWTIGLRHPLQPQRRIAEFHLRDRALGTAGVETQSFEHEGRRLSHIIDPRTGWPAEGVISATVLAPTAAMADGLATACFVMDVEKVEDYCSRHPDVGVLLVCPASAPTEVKLRSFGLSESDCTWHK